MANNKITWHFNELLKTLSNVKSFYSGKRIERMLLFTTVLISANVYIYTRINSPTFTSTEYLIIAGALLTYAGFNTIQGYKTPRNDEKTNIPNGANKPTNGVEL